MGKWEEHALTLHPTVGTDDPSVRPLPPPPPTLAERQTRAFEAMAVAMRNIANALEQMHRLR